MASLPSAELAYLDGGATAVLLRRFRGRRLRHGPAGGRGRPTSELLPEHRHLAPAGTAWQAQRPMGQGSLGHADDPGAAGPGPPPRGTQPTSGPGLDADSGASGAESIQGPCVQYARRSLLACVGDRS